MAEDGRGTLTCVGVGPGDPGLMTRRACEVLEGSDVVAAPVSDDGASLALQIARGACDLSGARVLGLSFPMSRSRDVVARSHRVAADAIEAELDAGADVALACLGDVAIYSTSAYVRALVAADGYEVRTVAGVPSFCAAAAALNETLAADRDEPIVIVPAASPALGDALSMPGDAVIMKTGRRYDDVRRALDARGLADRTCVVENCGLPGERVTRGLGALAQAPSYFTVLIVGKGERP